MIGEIQFKNQKFELSHMENGNNSEYGLFEMRKKYSVLLSLIEKYNFPPKFHIRKTFLSGCFLPNFAMVLIFTQTIGFFSAEFNYETLSFMTRISKQTLTFSRKKRSINQKCRLCSTP